tara:strand:+ start:1394 stop:1774 length:381 start_codon:yes stop_codon:yes gene_type:complete
VLAEVDVSVADGDEQRPEDAERRRIVAGQEGVGTLPQVVIHVARVGLVDAPRGGDERLDLVDTPAVRRRRSPTARSSGRTFDDLVHQASLGGIVEPGDESPDQLAQPLRVHRVEGRVDDRVAFAVS